MGDEEHEVGKGEERPTTRESYKHYLWGPWTFCLLTSKKLETKNIFLDRSNFFYNFR